MTQESQFGVQTIPFFHPTSGGAATKAMGILTFSLTGLLSIGSHSFHYTQPIDLEHFGFRVRRLPGSSVVDVTTPSGERLSFHFSCAKSTWSEVRTFEQPSTMETVRYYVRDMFFEHGPIMGSLVLLLCVALYCYFYLLTSWFQLLLRAWVYVVIVVSAGAAGSLLFEYVQGRRIVTRADETLVSAYTIPIAVVLILLVQLPIAAFKNRRLGSWLTLRAAISRVLLLSVIVAAGTWFHLWATHGKVSPFVAAWSPVIGSLIVETKADGQEFESSR